jgi:hypothetical protein
MPSAWSQVHVGDDHIGDVFGLDADAADGFGGLDEIGDVPLFEELVAVEAGVDQDVAVSGADQPHHHGDIERTRGIGARYELIDGEIGDGGVADGVDFVVGLC